MSQTESQILNTFLVSPSSLQETATLNTFISFFPASKRSHPDIPILYRSLQAQRSALCQIVKKNIQLECKLGMQTMKAMDVERSVLEEKKEEMQKFTMKSSALPEILKRMEEAVEKMQKEIEYLGKGCDDLLKNMKIIVGEMNDFQYDKGSLDRSETTMDGLRELIETCEELLKTCENV
ncbi:hypothetical protein T552_02230 [Pneumocystis carinii B80]|uniref:Uncharacterized protein n=1 Tax=Pneumocystis carinii (strain B80) TaxID=1408658 RepID=A0A0W4ZHD6_PNEC8|nr:hypothetical protein T552_02230 [Pneumocystis carinii B80]KTW27790.1 hypothetical protein T552_02230 [Pneumocystis carinii B80]